MYDLILFLHVTSAQGYFRAITGLIALGLILWLMMFKPF